MKKEGKITDKNWQQLNLRYRQWENLLAKGRPRMKKKVNKDGKQYYDFDFGRNTYYYSFPQDHVSLNPAAFQKKLINELIQENCEDYSSMYVDCSFNNWMEIEHILRPYELSQVLKQMKDEFQYKINMLRIQKTLRIKKMQKPFGSDNAIQKGLIELMDSQIRAFVHKLIRLEDNYQIFGSPLAQRLKNTKSNLKSRQIDQFHFTSVSKGDFIVFSRIKHVNQAMQFNSLALSELIDNFCAVEEPQIHRRSTMKRGQKIYLKKCKSDVEKSEMSDKLRQSILQKDPLHFQESTHRSLIESTIQQLDYISNFQKNVDKIRKLNHISNHFTSSLLNYEQVVYLPLDNQQTRNRIQQKCAYYFPSNIIENQIFSNSDEHLCYKINSFCFLQLKAIWETYNPLFLKEEGSLLKIKSVMQKQLQLVFSGNWNKLANIREHSIKVISHQKWYQNFLYTYTPANEKAAIMEKSMNLKRRYQDPLICSFLNLLGIVNEKNAREGVYKLTENTMKNNVNLLKKKATYYKSCCMDEKSHLIKVLNDFLTINSDKQKNEGSEGMKNLYYQIIHNNLIKKPIDVNILQSHYMLIYLMCVDKRYQLLELMNAQIMCMVKIQNYVKLLWRKSRIPFQMTPEFMIRFTEGQNIEDPYDFLKWDTNDAHVQQIFKEMQNEECDRDQIIWKNDGTVEVRRKMSDNPILEGKSILYSCSYQHLDKVFERIQFLCSDMIEKRESFATNGQYTGIVDRAQLVYQFLCREEELQKSKLKLLEIYTQVVIKSVSPKSIKQSYKKMHNIFMNNYIVDVTEPHYAECYRNETAIMEKKGQILKMMMEKQKNLQKSLTKKFQISRSNSNISNNMPELSSMYYAEQIAQDTVIHEVGQQQSQSDLLSQFSSEQHHNHSQVSSILESGTQYHLKVTFKQILAANSVQGIKEGNNKKQELMNRKRQRLVNDTTLGYILPRKRCQLDQNIKNQQDQFYYYLHYVIEHVMDKLDNISHQYNLKPQYCVELFNGISDLVKQFQFTEYVPQLRPDLLPLVLNTPNKYLTKLLEKTQKSGSLSGRGGTEYWEFLPSAVISKIIASESGHEVDQLRGLYLAINTLHFNDLYFQQSLIEKVQASTKYGNTNILKNLFQRYSSSQQNYSQIIKSGPNFVQKRGACQCKILGMVKQSGEHNLLCIGNYLHYYKAICTIDISFQQLIKSCNRMFLSQIKEVELLKTQLMLMKKYGCCSEIFFQYLQKVPQIQSKVFLKKKIDFIDAFQRSIISKENVSEVCKIMLDNPGLNNLFNFKKFAGRFNVNNINQLVNLSANFEEYIKGLTNMGMYLNCVSQKINYRLQKNDQIKTIKGYIDILPNVGKQLHIFVLNNKAVYGVFEQYLHFLPQPRIGSMKENHQMRIFLQQQRIKLGNLGGVTFFNQIKESMKQWYHHSIHRYYQEMKIEHYEQRELKCQQRHCARTVNSVQKNGFPDLNTLQKHIQPIIKETKDSLQTIKLRQWIQTQFIIFGASIRQQQLISFRKMLINPACIFPIFWEQNLHHLINARDLAKMKSTKIDQNEIIERFRQQYYTITHLKKSYKNFVQDITEYQIKEETSDLFLVLYVGNPKYFQRIAIDWSFLQKYGTSSRGVKNSIDDLCAHLKKTNPARFQPQFTQRSLVKKIKNKCLYKLDQIKDAIWNSADRDKIRVLDLSRRYLKSRLNYVKSRGSKTITSQVMLIMYKKQRLLEMINYLNIDFMAERIYFDDYKEMFDRLTHQGHTQMNPSEKFIFHLTEKDNQSKGEFLKIKDDVISYVHSNQFYQKLIREKFYSMSLSIIDGELDLKNLLNYNMLNQATFRDAKILKQTINKILVPKVKLNPFLQSPLIIDNYFIAGTIKLSYIDQFLNKMRNRSIMVQLAEGGFGFLIKVNQLNESVNSLCKAIIGFSEKQYSDRLRSFYETFEDVKEKYKKLNKQNQNLKATLKIVKQFEGKQIKYVIYQKLNNSITTFYEHQKNNQILVNLYKCLENKIAKEMNGKYEQKIIDLEKQNSELKRKFIDFQTNLKKSTTSQVHQAKDQLFAHFKDKAEEVLHKNFIKQEENQEKPNFMEIQKNDSEILIKKLKMQRVFYELKLSKIQSHLKQKIASLQKSVVQQSKLQNLLLMEQQKTRVLSQQLKGLHKCSIQNQFMKKQMEKKDEDDAMYKFRIVKVNQSLKGKIKRLETQISQDNSHWVKKIDQLGRIQNKPKSSFSVQVSSDVKPKMNSKRTSFNIRTEGSSSNTKGQISNIEVSIWRQKWLKSEKNQQLIIEELKKIYQHFIFTKNAARLTANLKGILEQNSRRKM